MYGEQLMSRTSSAAHLFRNRTASTSTSLTLSSAQHEPWTARCQLLCDFLKIFRLKTRPISLTVVTDACEQSFLYLSQVTSERLV